MNSYYEDVCEAAAAMDVARGVSPLQVRSYVPQVPVTYEPTCSACGSDITSTIFSEVTEDEGYISRCCRAPIEDQFGKVIECTPEIIEQHGRRDED